MFCILIDPSLLRRRRKERMRKLGDPLISGYTDMDSIQEELGYCRELAGKKGWTIIDLSYRPVEDAAQEIIGRLGR